jgi:hypothetical protein
MNVMGYESARSAVSLMEELRERGFLEKKTMAAIDY